jgi:hypothetical protein
MHCFQVRFIQHIEAILEILGQISIQHGGQRWVGLDNFSILIKNKIIREYAAKLLQSPTTPEEEPTSEPVMDWYQSIIAEMERLKNEGFQILNETPKHGADNKLICFLHPKGTNGVLVELCQTIR